MNERRFADETRQSLCLLTVLITLILLAYANTLFSPFNFDDEVVLNQELPQSGDRYQKVWPPQYRHLFFASLKINQVWQAEDPFGYHLFNLTLHALTSITLFCIAWLTFKYAIQNKPQSFGAMAFLCAALFAVHPLHTEAVTYISGRASSLAGLFYFLSLLCFICASLRQNQARVLRLLFFFLALAMFVLSFFSKETSLSLPLVLIAYDVCLMRNQHWTRFKERLIFFYLPIPVFALIFILKSEGISLTHNVPKRRRGKMRGADQNIRLTVPFQKRPPGLACLLGVVIRARHPHGLGTLHRAMHHISGDYRISAI